MIPSIEEIELALYKYFNKEICITTTTMFFNHEIDFLTIRKKTGYTVEVEIKRSVADMKAEQYKKHNHESDKIAQFYYCFPSKILNKCKNLVPQKAGILEIFWTGNDWKINMIKRAGRNTRARPLTQEEINQILRYSNYRIWSCKKKIIKLQNKLKNYDKKRRK